MHRRPTLRTSHRRVQVTPTNTMMAERQAEVACSRRCTMRGTGYNIRTRTGRVKRKILADVIRCVVEAAQPDKIVLFGSAARGEMGPNSDLDLLVIKGGEFDRGR